jgi:hypothetical protein
LKVILATWVVFEGQTGALEVHPGY